MLGKWVAKTKGEQRIPLYECIRSVLAMTPPSGLVSKKPRGLNFHTNFFLKITQKKEEKKQLLYW